MKYLFLSPHPDDVELTCGATIARLKDDGHQVHVTVYSNCDLDVTEIARAHGALKVITHFDLFPRRHFDEHRQKILDKMISLRDHLHPDVVFIPDLSDVHQDHQVISREGLRAFKTSSDVITYAHSHNQIESLHNYFVVVNNSHVGRKLRALEQYHSQAGRAYFNTELLLGVMRYYGTKCNSEYAEAFRIMKSSYK
jgi:LmbE family N-acetylglucosaminyl deacetylase